MDRDRVNRRMEAMVKDIEAYIEALEEYPIGSVIRDQNKIDSWRAKAIDHRLFIYCCKLADIEGRKTYSEVSKLSVVEQEKFLESNSPYLKPSSGGKPDKIGRFNI